MAGISSLGIGSGLDLGNLVDSLVAAERSPIENSLNRRESQLVADLSGIGLMKSALSGFQTSLAGLADTSSYNTRAFANSNTAALGVTVDNDAEVGSYNIEVNNLAASQSLASTAYSSVTDSVGTGSIQLRFGSITGPGFGGFAVNADRQVQTITVDSSNNTLAGLKDHINSNDFGVTAAIVNDGSGYRLTLTSDFSGVENALEISVSDSGDGNDTDAAGLSSLAYNAVATNLSETQAAANANISVNGLAITSDTNSLNEVIEGVTLNLKEVTTSAFTLSVTESSSQISSSIKSVIESYNKMIIGLNDLASPGSTTEQSGLLFGDAGLRTFTNGLRRIITSEVDGLSGSITALTNIGINTQSDGTLAIDESRFNSAIEANPTGALALFAPVGQTSDSLISLNASSKESLPGKYAINITSISTQGQLDGAAGVNSLIVDANNDNLTISIDGISTGVLSLTQGTYATAADLAAEIQSQINSASTLSSANLSVAVSYDSSNDSFVFTSNAYGSSSEVEISAVDTNSVSDFGLSVASGSTGVDVAGTIGGATATGVGQSLSLSNGLSIEVLGGSIGSRGSLDFSRGFVESLNELLDDYLNFSSGSIAAREEGLDKSLKGIADQRLTLNLRMDSVEARLVAQFSALDLLLSRFQSTGNFLAQQIESLPGSGQLINN
ncbi:MAG: flagellar hook-associated protein 2 [Planctomycetota bacterium]|jgi:flagellar hook-associated protein 2